MEVFHLFLSLFDGTGHHFGFDVFTLFDTHLVHDGFDAFTAEDTEKMVFETEVEPALSRIALPSGTTAELIVDTAAFMPFRPDDVEPSESTHLVVDLDVDATARHIGRDRDGAFLAGVLDDLRFVLVVFGVEHVVRYLVFFEKLVQYFRLFDRRRADENRLPFAVTLFDVTDDRVELLPLRLVDQVRHIFSNDRDIGRNGDDIEPVNLREFRRFGLCCTRHTRQFVVHAEIVLEGDIRKRLGLLLDLDTLLRFKRLVQPFAETTPFAQASRKFVDDHDLTIFDDVVDVPFEEMVGFERLIEMVGQNGILHRV